MRFTAPPDCVLVRQLGAGSIFEVALVEHGGRRCLCKRLKLRMLTEPAALAAMACEAELLRRLRHPALPGFIAAGRDARGPYLLEASLPLPSLRALVEEAGGPLPRTVLVPLGRAAFAALASLHAAADDGGPLELVHGDLAPDHVLWGDASVRFIDLGQAHFRGRPGQVGQRGTLPYVAPEILREEAAPDQAGDVYALAASLAFAALGREPCHQPPGASRLVELAERGLDLASLGAAGGAGEPGPLVDVLRAVLAFERAARPRCAAEVAAMLARR